MHRLRWLIVERRRQCSCPRVWKQSSPRKAEVVSYDDLVTAGSMTAARAAGKVRMEGKDYVMADGDVVEFRFNV
jgi:ribosome-binding ATPase YchF (GTP1/OBG family)